MDEDDHVDEERWDEHCHITKGPLLSVSPPASSSASFSGSSPGTPLPSLPGSRPPPPCRVKEVLGEQSTVAAAHPQEYVALA